MGSQIQTHIFIQGLIRKELFRHESGNIFFLYPFGHCYRHAIRRWLSPIPDMAETINWPNGALAIDILAHIVLMTPKTTRFGRWSVTTRKDISTSSIPNTIRRDSQSGAGEIKIPGLLTVENLLTSCGR